MQVSSSKEHDYSKKCKHVMTETEVPFLFIRINSRAAPFDPLHGVFQHHEFITQNLFIKKKKIMSQKKYYSELSYLENVSLSSFPSGG
jgi:hypothetical protein